MEPRREYIVCLGNDADFDGNIPIVSASELVRCDNCIMHEKCMTEDTFRFCGIEDGYCRAGKRRDGEQDAAD